MRKYQYFGPDKVRGMIPICEAIAEVEPTTEELEGLYLSVLRVHGLGVPRPTHVIATELVPIEDTVRPAQMAEEIA